MGCFMGIKIVFVHQVIKHKAQLHALEQFSSMYDMTHGLALAIITPKWMTYLLKQR